MQPFVHLHVHSQYSILDGQAAIPALVDKAMKNGMKGIAVTDHGNMFGIKEFFNYTNKKNGGINGGLNPCPMPNIGQRGMKFPYIGLWSSGTAFSEVMKRHPIPLG